MKKLIYIVLDGAGDDVIDRLGCKTPLEAAKMPNLDKIAENSRLGLLQTISPDIAPESDEAMLAMLGFDPFRFHKGRGPLEAFGAGIKSGKGDVVMRCNFAKVNRNEITDTEYIPTKDEIKKIESIKIKNIRFKYTYGHRGVLILSGKVSANISNTNPTYQIVRRKVTTALPKNQAIYLQTCRPLDKTASAKNSAKLVNEFTRQSQKVLGSKVVISRGAGSSLPKIRIAGRWTMLADSMIDRAIGRLAGMHIVEKQADYKKLFLQIKSGLSKGNVCVQIKKPDSLAHHGDFKGKAKEFENLDRELFSKILSLTMNQKQTTDNMKLCITADHCTSSILKAHTSAPVPVLLYDGKKSDGIRRFSENCCRYGSLGMLHGAELFGLLKKL